jgi:hypothetical protein
LIGIEETPVQPRRAVGPVVPRSVEKKEKKEKKHKKEKKVKKVRKKSECDIYGVFRRRKKRERIVKRK